MRARFVPLLAVLGAACDAPTTGLPPGTGEPPPPPAPRLELDTDRIDLGRVPVGVRARASVGVLNVGDAPASLRVRPGAGVTACAADSGPWCAPDGLGPWALAPGERRSLAFELRPETVAPRLSVRVELSPCESCPSRAVDLFAESVADALVCEPSRLDFDAVRVGACRRARTECRSPGTVPVGVLDLGPLPGQPLLPDFRAETEALPLELEPGRSLGVEVEFCPGAVGPRSVDLGVEIDLARAERGFVRLPVRGVGLVPTFRVHTGTTALGEVAVYGQASTFIEVESVTDQPLVLSVTGLPSRLLTAEPARLTLPPGGRLPIELRVRPEGLGPRSVEVTVQSAPPEVTAVSTRLSLVGIDPEPCSLEWIGTPSPLLVRTGRALPTPIFLGTADSTPCVVAVEQLRFDDDTEGRLPTPIGPTGPATFTVQPGAMSVVVPTVRPRAMGDHRGRLRLRVAQAGDGLVDVPIELFGVDGPPGVVPEAIGLGARPPNCEGDATRVSIVPPWLPVGGLASAEIIPGGVGLTAPVVEPIDRLDARVPLDTPSRGAFGGWVLLRFQDARTPFRVVPVWGEVSETVRTQRHTVRADADLVIAIDQGRQITGQALSSGAAAFFAQLAAAPEQVRVSVLASIDGANPRFGLPTTNTFGESFIDAADPVAGPKLDTMLGFVSAAARQLEPVRAILAATQPEAGARPPILARRAGHPLVVLFALTATSRDRAPEAGFLDMLRLAAEDAELRVVTYRPGTACRGSNPPDPRLFDLAIRAGGVAVESCDALGAEVWAAVREAVRGGRRVQLESAPAPGSLEVRLDGQLVAESDGVGNLRWRYEPESRTLVFEPAWAPEPGTEVELRYRPACP